jgi:hypothetical protein
MQPNDTTEKRFVFDVEGTDYVLIIDQHPNDEELLSAARYEIYFVNKKSPDFQYDIENILPMPQVLDNILCIFKSKFEIEQDGVKLE